MPTLVMQSEDDQIEAAQQRHAEGLQEISARRVRHADVVNVHAVLGGLRIERTAGR
jgi:hypothetical protein